MAKPQWMTKRENEAKQVKDMQTFNSDPRNTITRTLTDHLNHIN